MSFCFNFPNPDNNSQSQSPLRAEPTKMETNETTPKAIEIDSKNVTYLPETLGTMTYDLPGGLSVKCYRSEDIERHIVNTQSDCVIAHASQQHSDLLPNVYEGGLTLWECSLDLAKYLVCRQGELQISNKHVLELGCGAGLPGICCMKLGAKAVDFQDFNKEVLESYTLQNARLAGQGSCSTRFLAGDWSAVSSYLQSKSYDLIVTAETIYNTENYDKLHAVFENLLSRQGVILLAAKSNYFGVGGGTQLFIDFVERKKVFNIQTMHTVEAGIPRFILQLSFIQEGGVLP